MTDTKEIPSAPGYFATRDGQIFSQQSNRFLKSYDNRKGYLYVNLGRRKREYVHRLVGETFIGEIPAGSHVCHYDGDRANNCVENLRIATPSENEQDKRRHGTYQLGIRNPLTHLTADNIRVIRNDPRLQRIIAEEYGITQSNVSVIKARKSWGHIL